MTTKGKINWFAIALHLSADPFVVFVMCTFKLCHLGVKKGLSTWERKKSTVKQVKADEETAAHRDLQPGLYPRLLDLNVRTSHLDLIKWIIRRTKSFLTHMNRIAKLPTFGNSRRIFYQTQLNYIITRGEKRD